MTVVAVPAVFPQPMRLTCTAALQDTPGIADDITTIGHYRSQKRSIDRMVPLTPVLAATPFDGDVMVHRYMRMALEEAQAAGVRGEVPVGAVIVDTAGNAVLARCGNRTEQFADPTAHAELLAIRAAAAALRTPRLTGCDLWVTLEPCAMCAQAIAFARLRRLYFAAYDPKGGGVEHGARIFTQPTCHHRLEIIGGIEETAAGTLLRRFFAERR